MEVSRLKEEVEVLRNELHRAEVELEELCWLATTVLQHWLQLTYELESQTVSDETFTSVIRKTSNAMIYFFLFFK